MKKSNTNNNKLLSKAKAKMEFPLTDSMFTLIGKPDKVLPNGGQQYCRARLEKWVAANPHLVQNVRLRREKTPLKRVELALARERVERKRQEREQEREEALRRLVEERRPQHLRLIQTFALDRTVPPPNKRRAKWSSSL